MNQLIALPYLPVYIQTVCTAIELDLFSNLSSWKSADELAAELNLHAESTRYMLGALCSLGFLEKEGSRYRNAEETQRYLVKGNPEYMGYYLLFSWYSGGTVPINVKDTVLHGPGPMPDMKINMDACRSLWDKPLPGCRDHEVLRFARALPEYEHIRRVLDLGCNVGMNGAQVIRDREGRSGVLFDRKSMLVHMQKTVAFLNLENRVELIGGDFFTDPLGGPYDLIIASSIMAYVQEDKDAFLRRIYEALAPGGVVLCITEELEDDYSAPWDMVLGYLPQLLQGMPAGVLKGHVEQAAKAAGFCSIEKSEETLSCGKQTIYILRKER